MGKIRIIGVVGLPGSGKSTLFERPEYAQFLKKDDIGDKGKHGTGWQGNEEEIRLAVRKGQSAIVSDIELCNREQCEEFQNRIGIPVEWIYFENAPWKCALNCLYRYYFEDANRPLHAEIRKIKRLSSAYQPSGTVFPIMNKEIQSAAWECAVSCLHRFYCLDNGSEGNEEIGSLKPDIKKIKDSPLSR